MLLLPLKETAEQIEPTAATLREEVGDISGTSRDVFRVDQIPTDGTGAEYSPDPSLFSNSKKKEGKKLITITETEESQPIE